MTQNGELHACAAEGVHDAVLRVLDRLPRGRLLDAPAGHGALSAAAQKAGFTVTACDIAPEQFQAPGLECNRVDLGLPLPYGDATFDVVLCVEAVEHMENPFHLLRELRRVLRPGGTLILTTPNVLSLPSRVRILMTGLASWFDFQWTLSFGHIMPMSLPQLHTALTSAGFRLRQLTGSRVKPGARRLQPLGLIVSAVTQRTVTSAELRKLLLSRPALYSEILVVVAE